MAIERKLGPFIVMATTVAITAGCNSNVSPTGPESKPAAAISEGTGKPKNIPTHMKNGQALTPAEQAAVMSTKGHGEP